MNQVFKNRYKLSLLMLSASLMAPLAEANQCSTVNFLPLEIKGESYIAKIIGNNDQSVANVRSAKAIASGKHTYYLAEGEHKIILEQWVSKTYRKASRKGRSKKVKRSYNAVQTKMFQIDVKANQHYELALSSNKQDATVNITNIENRECSNDSSATLTARSHQKNLQSNEIFPKLLESKLLNVMANIYRQDNNKSNAKIHSRLAPVKMYPYFGAILDKDNALNRSELKVISVLPHSFANKIKLVKGDEIIELGKKPIDTSEKTPTLIMNKYLSSLRIGDDISVKVIRGSNTITLKGKYNPVVLPEVNYKILSKAKSGTESTLLAGQEIINVASLSGALNFEFEQLILEITDYYHQHSLKSGKITLNRNIKTNSKAGVNAFNLTIDLDSIVTVQDRLKLMNRPEYYLSGGKHLLEMRRNIHNNSTALLRTGAGIDATFASK